MSNLSIKMRAVRWCKCFFRCIELGLKKKTYKKRRTWLNFLAPGSAESGSLQILASVFINISDTAMLVETARSGPFLAKSLV